MSLVADIPIPGHFPKAETMDTTEIAVVIVRALVIACFLLGGLAAFVNLLWGK